MDEDIDALVSEARAAWRASACDAALEGRLLAALAAEGTPDKARELALRSLGKATPSDALTDAIRPWLDAAHAEPLRVRAAGALAELGAKDALRPALDDPCEDVRERAARGLAAELTPADETRLLAMLAADPGRRFRLATAHALGAHRDRPAVAEALQRAAEHDPDPTVRDVAGQAIAGR